MEYTDPKRRANQKPSDGDEDPFSAQGKLEYLRGPAGERDRLTLWKLGRGTLPGTADGGLLEGWAPE